MAEYKIIERAVGDISQFDFYIDNNIVFSGIANRMAVDYTDNPDGYLHFKTTDGANIFKIQEITPDDLVLEDSSGTQYNPTTVPQVWGYLYDINYFEWITQGGGGTTAARFDQLQDTFAYTGKAGHVPVVNPAMNALISTFLFNFSRITEHLDWGGNNPLQALDVRKRVLVDMVSGTPKFILDDDTANAPTPPNALLNDFTPTNISGNDWRIPANRLWRIDGIQYSNALDFDFEIVPASSGNIRQDIVYVTSDNELHYLPGTEGSIAAPIPQTSAPANSLIAVTFTVTEDSTTGNPNPAGSPWVTKESYIQQDVFSEGTYALPFTNRTRFNILAPGIITGFEDNSTAPAYDLNYDGQLFWLRNAGGDAVTLKHEGVADIQFWFYDGVDHNLPETGEIWQFKFNKVQSRMEFVGGLADDGSNYITFEEAFIWNTGDDLVFDLASENDEAMQVFIDGAIVFRTDSAWEQDGQEVELDVDLVDKYLFDGSSVKIIGITKI